MKRSGKVLISVGAVSVLILGFAAWYRIHFSMAPAQAFEAPGAASGPRVLIATQGSSFKDSVVAGVVEHLKTRQAYVRVIDISGLARENVAEWNVIVVLHTWEMGKPPAAAKAFIEGLADRRSLVVLATSGAGNFKMEGVDTISTASRMEDVPARVTGIDAKIDAILDRAGT